MAVLKKERKKAVHSCSFVSFNRVKNQGTRKRVLKRSSLQTTLPNLHKTATSAYTKKFMRRIKSARLVTSVVTRRSSLELRELRELNRCDIWASSDAFQPTCIIISSCATLKLTPALPIEDDTKRTRRLLLGLAKCARTSVRLFAESKCAASNNTVESESVCKAGILCTRICRNFSSAERYSHVITTLRSAVTCSHTASTMYAICAGAA
mmetsp:Transcript_2529/g.8098  ORF Transcript_2529/g.8098 Transcript_2529/m.8098 type:complete len:209 (-) Transcript_2529:531-1157(-)